MRWKLTGPSSSFPFSSQVCLLQECLWALLSLSKQITAETPPLFKPSLKAVLTILQLQSFPAVKPSHFLPCLPSASKTINNSINCVESLFTFYQISRLLKFLEKNRSCIIFWLVSHWTKKVGGEQVFPAGIARRLYRRHWCPGKDWCLWETGKMGEIAWGGGGGPRAGVGQFVIYRVFVEIWRSEEIWESETVQGIDWDIVWNLELAYTFCLCHMPVCFIIWKLSQQYKVSRWCLWINLWRHSLLNVVLIFAYTQIKQLV